MGPNAQYYQRHRKAARNYTTVTRFEHVIFGVMGDNFQHFLLVHMLLQTRELHNRRPWALLLWHGKLWKRWRATAWSGKSKFAISSGWLNYWQYLIRMTKLLAVSHPDDLTIGSISSGWLMGIAHSRLQSSARPPPRIAKGDEQVIRHADREPPWTASLPVAEKQSYLINCTLSVTHEVAYPKKSTYSIIHTNLIHFQRI